MVVRVYHKLWISKAYTFISKVLLIPHRLSTALCALFRVLEATSNTLLKKQHAGREYHTNWIEHNTRELW